MTALPLLLLIKLDQQSIKNRRIGGIGVYEDIINLPHHVSATRPQMSMMDRAAQFSPFAALVGCDAAIKETARLNDQK